MSEINRRDILIGLASLMAAPAIVRYGNLMPVKVMPETTALELLWKEIHENGHFGDGLQLGDTYKIIGYDEYGIRREELITSTNILRISGTRDITNAAILSGVRTMPHTMPLWRTV